MNFMLAVSNGIASIWDYDEQLEMPFAEGFGDTNDAAVADLFSKITLNTEVIA